MFKKKKTSGDYIIHHGIKGQKWGVRRFQNADGTLTAAGRKRYGDYSGDDYFMEKGTPVYRVTTGVNDNKSNKYVYTDIDQQIYEGPFSRFLMESFGQPFVIKNTYETTENIKAPSREKMMANFEERYAKNQNKIRTYTDAYIKMMEERGHPYTRLDSWKDEKERRFAAYNLMLENNAKEVDSILKDFSKVGYNAVLDYNNVNVYNEAVEPFIVANSNKTLKWVKSTLIDYSQAVENSNALRAELNKKGKNLVL